MVFRRCGAVTRSEGDRVAAVVRSNVDRTAKLDVVVVVRIDDDDTVQTEARRVALDRHSRHFVDVLRAPLIRHCEPAARSSTDQHCNLGLIQSAARTCPRHC